MINSEKLFLTERFQDHFPADLRQTHIGMIALYRHPLKRNIPRNRGPFEGNFSIIFCRDDPNRRIIFRQWNILGFRTKILYLIGRLGLVGGLSRYFLTKDHPSVRH